MTNDNDDLQAWKEFTQDIKKIKAVKKAKKETPKEIKVQKHIDIPDISFSKHDRELTVGKIDNIDANTAKKFRRGEFGVEATLDLHGYTEDRAYMAVNSFIKNCYSQGKRSVLIITGKGIKKESDDFFNQKGILKERVPEWLNSAELRPFVLSFVHPHENLKLGGSGALLILLRRHINK